MCFLLRLSNFPLWQLARLGQGHISWLDCEGNILSDVSYLLLIWDSNHTNKFRYVGQVSMVINNQNSH